MDAASHTGIDDIRELIDSAHYKPNTARYKVYIIDEVHMLSKQAFNGLLKTLEEPPEHVKFIFATTEARKVPVTVLSRCQRFDLKRIDIGELVEHLQRVTAQESATAEQAALALIARAAEGSVRDALSILDRAIAFGAGKVETDAVRGLLGLADRTRIFDLLETVLKGDAGTALQQLAQLNRDGAEPGQIIADLADAVHAVTLIKAAGAASADPAASEAERARATSQPSVRAACSCSSPISRSVGTTSRATNGIGETKTVAITIDGSGEQDLHPVRGEPVAEPALPPVEQEKREPDDDRRQRHRQVDERVHDALAREATTRRSRVRKQRRTPCSAAPRSPR